MPAPAIATLDPAFPLHAALGIPGEAGQIIPGNIFTEIIEEQEMGRTQMYFPNPNARRRRTPAPSRAGLVMVSCLTGQNGDLASRKESPLFGVIPGLPVAPVHLARLK
jgi:hypothetical protein